MLLTGGSTDNSPKFSKASTAATAMACATRWIGTHHNCPSVWGNESHGPDGLTYSPPAFAAASSMVGRFHLRIVSNTVAPSPLLRII